MLIGITLVFLLAGCGERYYGDYKYSDFERIDHWNDLETLGHDDYVFVYVYNRDFLGNETPGTQMINEDIFTFGMENTFDYPMYRINQREVSGPRPENVQRRDPKLLIVRHGTVVDKFYGALPIMGFLEAVDAERYIFPELLGLLADDSETFEGYAYHDFSHLRTWRDVHTLGRTQTGIHTIEMVYVYHRDVTGTSSESETINEALFPYAVSEDLSLWLANITTTIGLLPEGYEHTVPALMLVVNENIVALYEGQTDIMAFIDALVTGSIDLEDYLDS